jgi:hypothetical protein
MTRCWKRITALTVLAGLLAVSANAQGGRRGFPPVPQPDSNKELDAQGIRLALDKVLKAYPPSLRQVLQLDPSLLTDSNYLSSYPKLAAFLKEHPAITHNASYYVGTMKMPSPQKQIVYQVQDRTSDSVIFFAVVLTLVLVLAWLMRAAVEQRRSIQASKVRMDAQMKILEKFASNEDLLKFVQTPAGQRFLENASMPAPAKTVAAPIAQILQSTQFGCVLLIGGVGLNYPIRGFLYSRLLSGVGIVAIALGIGFLVSALTSYIVSRKLGLLNNGDVTSQTPSS